MNKCEYIVLVKGITKDGIPTSHSYARTMNCEECNAGIEELIHRHAKYQMEEPELSKWNWDHITEVAIDMSPNKNNCRQNNI